jgi:hypothetical protein
MPILQTPPYSVSSTDSSNSSKGLITIPFNEEQEFPLLQKQQIKNDNNSQNVCWQKELDRQIREKKMAEMIEAEKRMAEQKATEREAQLQLEREERERASEQEKRTHKSEVRILKIFLNFKICLITREFFYFRFVINVLRHVWMVYNVHIKKQKL